MSTTNFDGEMPSKPTGMKLDWAGCLSDLRDQYTSVELQKQASIWMEEMALGYLRQREEEEQYVAQGPGDPGLGETVELSK